MARSTRGLVGTIPLIALMLLSACGSPEVADAPSPAPDDPAHVEVSVLLDHAVSAAQRDELQRALEEDPQVVELRFETREEAYAFVRDELADHADLLETVTPDMLPESFRLRTRDRADALAVEERYANWAGVGEIAVLQSAAEDGPQRREEEDPEGPRTVAVFMEDGISDDEREALQTALLDDRHVTGVRAESREEAYERFREFFADDEDLLHAVEPDALPESLLADVDGVEAMQAVASRFRTWPGVEAVAEWHADGPASAIE